MISHTIRVSVFLILMSIPFISCENKQDSVIKEDVENRIDVQISGERPPEIVPDNTGLEKLRANPDASWSEYDTFYKEVVLKQINKPYFRNLQILTISTMTKKSIGLESAPEEVVRFYLDELTGRKFINDPGALVILLSYYAKFSSSEELEKLAMKPIVKNLMYLRTAENAFRQSHLQRYGLTYKELKKYVGPDNYWIFNETEI